MGEQGSVNKASGDGAPQRYEELHFIDSTRPVWNYSLFTDEDVRNFQAGKHYRLYEHFGNKQLTVLSEDGYYFAVWAPNATYVSVVGNFNNWNKLSHPLFVRQDSSGIWEGFIPKVVKGESYKYHIQGFGGVKHDKGDPFAHFWEQRPQTASIAWPTEYEWKDAGWMRSRRDRNKLDAPISVYEIQLSSWMRPDPNNEESFNSYGAIADLLIPYLHKMQFTHVEFMPVMEHPYDGSWGYQGTGFFAPTSRFGNPQDFMWLVDRIHQEGFGIILDWVPSHFPYDQHGLFMFDGTHTYEYADMRKGFHPDWNSYVFNYQRGEVKSFLISSARFWCDKFHADGLRVDAVSSMLRLDYSREEGEWEPNAFGNNGNLEAIEFIKDLNETLYRDFPDIVTIAEESTDWPGISRPTWKGGMGFGMKWMMGWMHDTLDYFKADPYERPALQNKLSFSMMYYYDENFMLPLSHDEVVHGKSPMIYKMPGDTWQQFANLRLLYTYMWTHPGAKLLFMGNEIAATTEWAYKKEIPWYLTNLVSHGGMQYCVSRLNVLYRNQPALYEKQFKPGGFEWLDLNHREEAVVAYKRHGNEPAQDVIVVLNMKPEVRRDWMLSVPGLTGEEVFTELFNSNDSEYWGTGDVYNPSIEVIAPPEDSEEHVSLRLHLPPLGGIVIGRLDKELENAV